MFATRIPATTQGEGRFDRGVVRGGQNLNKKETLKIPSMRIDIGTNSEPGQRPDHPCISGLNVRPKKEYTRDPLELAAGHPFWRIIGTHCVFRPSALSLRRATRAFNFEA